MLYTIDLPKRKYCYRYDTIHIEISSDTLTFTSEDKVKNKKYTTSYNLLDFYSHRKFKDMACFCIFAEVKGIQVLDINPETKDKSPLVTAFNEGGIVVSFPDTESTFDDCRIIIPRKFEDGELYVSTNGFMTALTTWPENLIELMPDMHFSGPSSMPADSFVALNLFVGKCAMNLESLYRITVTSDNGYVPKRKMNVETDTTIDLKVYSTGLSAGDVINVYAGTEVYPKIAKWAVRIE